MEFKNIIDSLKNQNQKLKLTVNLTYQEGAEEDNNNKILVEIRGKDWYKARNLFRVKDRKKSFGFGFKNFERNLFKKIFVEKIKGNTYYDYNLYLMDKVVFELQVERSYKGSVNRLVTDIELVTRAIADTLSEYLYMIEHQKIDFEVEINNED